MGWGPVPLDPLHPLCTPPYITYETIPRHGISKLVPTNSESHFLIFVFFFVSSPAIIFKPSGSALNNTYIRTFNFGIFLLKFNNPKSCAFIKLK